MFAAAIHAILRDHCTAAAIRAIEAGDPGEVLWRTVADQGFLELLTAEAEGGAALSLPELHDVLRVIGYFAVPLPLAQTIVARAIVAAADRPASGMITIAGALHRRPDGAIHCPLIPFGTIADIVLAQEEDAVWLLPCSDALRQPTGLHHSQIASLTWPPEQPVRRIDGAGPALVALAAALHATLLSGAMERVFELTLGYCNDREQFGRSLGKFQAVQHQLSVMAEHIAAAAIAAEAAFQSSDATPKMLAAAIAKSRTSEAASLVASTAHALHGAIGITEEYDLQLYTRRLHEWRMAHGSEAHWNAWIGHAVVAGQGTIAHFARAATPLNFL